MKTGYICASGYNIAASATRGDRRIVAIVLGARSGKKRNDKVSELLEQGFSDVSWEGTAPETLDELSPDREYGVRPEHMGPVVCNGRYGKNEPYAVDAKLRAQSEARKVAKIAEATKFAAATAFPLIKGQKVPIPTLRPER
jgi:D-alanyl-D-alanine carboxypeptidase